MTSRSVPGPPAPRPEAAIGAARLSLLVGALVLVAKVVAWRITGSVALFSDAMESIVNVVAAAAALVTLKISAEPPDEEHPFGHGKAEYFSAVFEGVLIMVAAAAIAMQAIERLLDARELEEVGVGLLVSLAASAVNALLAAYLLRRGRELRSPALVADGKHIGADVATSGGVALGVGLAWATGWWILDPILALVVTVNVVWTGWNVVRSSVGGLMDESLPEEDIETVRSTIAANLSDDAIEVHDLRTRRASHVSFIQFHLVVPGEMSVSTAHDLCDRLEDALARALPGARTQIHIEPEGHAEHRGRVAGPP